MTLHKVPFTKTQLNETPTKLMGNKNINKDQFNERFVGFTEAEGNFTISIDNRGPLKNFNFRFTIGLHIDDEPLLLFIRDKLGCGKVSTDKDNASSYFIISDTSDLKSIFLPIMDRFPLNTTKFLFYLDFKKVLLLEKTW